MFDYAEENLFCRKNDKKWIKTYINDNNTMWEQLAVKRGYVKQEQYPIHDAEYFINDIPAYLLPGGYKIQSMADDYNIELRRKVQSLGFHHPDPKDWTPADVHHELRKAPDYRKDLDLYVVAPDGEYIACCIAWYDDVNKIAILEPVATHPLYRRRGFGKAVIYEAIRRVANEGAAKVLVGSGQLFYQAIGFKITHIYYAWIKEY